MKNYNSNLFPLLTGLLVGGAAVYFLKSDKGQQMVDLALMKGESFKSEFLDNSQEFLSASKKSLNEVLNNSEEKLSQISEIVKETAHDKLGEFEKGINNAKRKITNI